MNNSPEESEKSSGIETASEQDFSESSTVGESENSCEKNSSADAQNSCDSDVEIARIKASSKNLRTRCGCLLLLVLSLLFVVSYPIYKSFSTGEKMAETTARGIGKAVDILRAVANQKPDVEITYGANFVSTSVENKYVLASLKERVDVKPEFKKYKLLSASLKLSVTAEYEYFIPLRGIKFDVRKSRDDGKLYFTFYFDTLTCDSPVKYTQNEREEKQSMFSSDVNKALSDYQKNDFPKYLLARGENPQNMETATTRARKAAERYIRENYFPQAGISDNEIGAVEIVFSTPMFDTFKAGIKKRNVELK